MPRSSRALLLLAAGATLLVSGCNKPPPPKVDAAAEQSDATARAKQRAYGGEAVKALESAQALGADLDRKAEEAVAKAEK